MSVTLLDMLPGLKAEDSGCREVPVPFLFHRLCPGGYLAWFSHVFTPHWGILRLARATPYPPRSHIVSAGFTFRMPYGRGVDG